MSVTAANFLSLSLSYMRAMIGDCETWRAMVAQPDTDWGTLATLIAAGTSSQSEALNRIRQGRLQDEENDDQHVIRPRCVLRHFDGNTSMRVSTTGFSFSGLIYVCFEYPIPKDYQENPHDSYVDAENKIGGIIQELSGLETVAGYLHLTDIDITAFGQGDPDQSNGDQFYVAELAIHHKGSIL